MIVYQDMYYWPSSDIRKLHIYLPNEYDQTNERYPVMYMFDGHNLYHDYEATYGKNWGLESFLDEWDKKIITLERMDIVKQQRLREAPWVESCRCMEC